MKAKMYQVDGVKDGKFYVVTIHGLPSNASNVTQGFSKTDAQAMAIDLISIVTGAPKAEIAVTITWA